MSMQMASLECLEDAELSPPAAKAVVKVLFAQIAAAVLPLATKAELKAEIGALRQEVKADIGALRQELKSEIDELRQEFKADIGALRQELRDEIDDLRQETRTGLVRLRSELELMIVRENAALMRRITRLLMGAAGGAIGVYLSGFYILWEMLKR